MSGNPVGTSCRNYTVPPALIKENKAKTDAERKSSKQDIVTNLSLKCKHEYVWSQERGWQKKPGSKSKSDKIAWLSENYIKISFEQ